MNYQKELEKIINNLNTKPSLLLHSCCAPCSSYTILYLAPFFNITVYYYNPNISPHEEYHKRVLEEINFISQINEEYGYHINCIDEFYDDSNYFMAIKDYVSEPERGKRCYICYEYRLRQTAIYAKENKFDYFCTTLSISPYKNAEWINEIGEKLACLYNVSFLPSDFKKNEGYKKSIELSSKYHLYRQDYCGCVYSRRKKDDEKTNNK